MTDHNHNPEHNIVSRYRAATVVGLGVTGYSVVRYLHARGLLVSVIDSNKAPGLAERLAAEYPDVSSRYGAFERNQLNGAELVVLSPGVSLAEPIVLAAKASGAEIIGDIELFFQENTRPVIAITGSNGKSTVTTLVGEMLQASDMQPLVAGNIGIPALDALTDGTDYDVAVLELSSFQLETTSTVPAESAAILNVSADHMDRYTSMGDYMLAKARVLRGAKRAVLPRHDEQLKQITNANKVLSFDLDEPADASEFGVKRNSNYRWLMKGEERLIKLREIPLVGLHNVKNVLAAFALIDFLKLPLERLVGAVKQFAGLPHRMQTVAVADDVTWVNDSKATNVGATSTALVNLESKLIWIAGGQAKGADFSDLRDAITPNIEQLILFGEDADKIQLALDEALPITVVKDMREAVQLAGQNAHAGSVVLLSPACASFDMYRNFEHRGDEFAAQVLDYIERSAA